MTCSTCSNLLKAETRPQTGENNDVVEQRIRELTAEGLSMRAVQQQVFGYVGGKAYDVVKPIYNQIKALQGGITEG